jgi:hypothetical protein
MRLSRLILSVAGLAAMAAFAPPLARSRGTPDFDVVFAGGTVVDGTGSPGRRADVGVSGAGSRASGHRAARSGLRTIDRAGIVVASIHRPG